MKRGTLIAGALVLGLAALAFMFRDRLRSWFGKAKGASAAGAAPGIVADQRTLSPAGWDIPTGGATNTRSRVGLRNVAEGAAGVAVTQVIGAAGGALAGVIGDLMPKTRILPEA